MSEEFKKAIQRAAKAANVAKLIEETKAEISSMPTQLHNEVEDGNIMMVEILAVMKDYINKQDGKGQTPLHYLFNKPNRKDTIKIATILKNAGADATIEDENGLTPIDLAKKNNYSEEVQELLCGVGLENAETGTDEVTSGLLGDSSESQEPTELAGVVKGSSNGDSDDSPPCMYYPME